MKEIKLTQGKVALVDDDDYERVNQYKWSAALIGSDFYAVRTIHCGGKAKSIKMHRFILNLSDSSIQVDHKNANTLDNTRSNIRKCSHAENMRNQGKKSTNTSGFKGVCLHKATMKWQASITLNRKQINLGYYIDKIEAARAYNAAAILHHGEFARLNEIPA